MGSLSEGGIESDRRGKQARLKVRADLSLRRFTSDPSIRKSPSNPGSSSPGANILKHIDSGTTTLDLTKVIAGTVATATRGLNETATATDGTTAVQRTGKPTGQQIAMRADVFPRGRMLTSVTLG